MMITSISGNMQAFKCHGGSWLSTFLNLVKLTVADSRLKRKQMVSIDSNKLRMFVHLFCIFDA